MAKTKNDREVSLHRELEDRYLSYALSTIVSRALPDVRDGLKPVQRRIIYGLETIGPKAAARFVKSARVVGEVIGKYHPHGDQAVYQAMVRMAQDFSLRYPLIDGQGNFGSLDGDAPAAMRYTEAKLSDLARELLADLGSHAVDMRPNYDGSLVEPAVLPARVPALLINGTSGIAVGISTSIPPHNLSEVIDGLVYLIENTEATTGELMRYIKGPDFPTRGIITTPKKGLKELYRNGKGSVALRGEYVVEKASRGRRNLVITSIPYTMNKARLVEAVFKLIQDKKLPMVSEVRDESTEDVRVVLELRDDKADPEEVAAFLFKKTELAVNIAVNLTCLTPMGVPERLSLKEILKYFLDFRNEVTVAMLTREREELLKRLHILEGLILVFSDLDRAIKIIRRSASRKDAAHKLVTEFGLDETQAEAILNMRLAALVRLERESIHAEMRERAQRVREIEKILSDDARVWAEVKRGLLTIKKRYGDPRRTAITAVADEPTYARESFMAHEEVVLTLSERGWIRRAKSFDPKTVPLREGDALLGHLETDTLSLVAFFTSLGKAYVARVADIPAPAKGYGTPIMTVFGFADGERVVAAILPEARPPAPAEEGQIEMFYEEPDRWFAALSNLGRGFLFRSGLVEAPSSRSGRVIYRLKKGEEIIGIEEVAPGARLLLATKSRLLALPEEVVPRRNGPSQGVALMKLKDETLQDFLVVNPEGAALITPAKGKQLLMAWEEMPEGSRGTRGKKMKGGIKALSLPETEE